MVGNYYDSAGQASHGRTGLLRRRFADYRAVETEAPALGRAWRAWRAPAVRATGALILGIILICLLVVTPEAARSFPDKKRHGSGSSYTSGPTSRIRHAGGLVGTTHDDSEPWIEIISWSPRAVVYHNFMSAAEADHIRSLADPSMQRSLVEGHGGHGEVNDIRTSSGTFLARQSDEVIRTVENRIAAWTMLPMPHQEDLQVLKYQPSQQYRAHMDVLLYPTPEDGQSRCATVLMYLTDVEEGGETVFPNGKWLDDEVESAYKAQGMSECARQGVAVKPRKGDALLFWSLTPDGHEDPSAMHAGCPVIKGEKWSATKWIHVQPFRAWQVKG